MIRAMICELPRLAIVAASVAAIYALIVVCFAF